MTGFGNSRGQNEQIVVTAEVRTVNNRFLKMNVRCPDVYAPLESRIEKTIRKFVSRGTVTAAIRVEPLNKKQHFVLNWDALEDYRKQLDELSKTFQLAPLDDVGRLLELPGAVIEQSGETVDPEADWPLIEEVLESTLKALHEFQIQEGIATGEDLRKNVQIISDQLDVVTKLAPQVVEKFRAKMLDRVQELLEKYDAQVDASDLIREVSIFADRCDINEEISRLTCHLEQFESFLNSDQSQGRKLDFLSQEMFREVNTIGSKANDVQIAHAVVEMKAAVEKIRENLQNVE